LTYFLFNVADCDFSQACLTARSGEYCLDFNAFSGIRFDGGDRGEDCDEEDRSASDADRLSGMIAAGLDRMAGRKGSSRRVMGSVECMATGMW